MGWIPSSATNVILNWPERIKTQPHDDRDNCFLPFDSKGPCGITVNNDIDDDSATKHSDSHMFRGLVFWFGFVHTSTTAILPLTPTISVLNLATCAPSTSAKRVSRDVILCPSSTHALWIISSSDLHCLTRSETRSCGMCCVTSPISRKKPDDFRSLLRDLRHWHLT